MMPLSNPLLTCWSAGKTALNGWISIPSVVSAQAMASAEWDSLTVDMQHGCSDYSDLTHILPVIASAGKAPVVRVPWLDEAMIMRALDAGALGIIAPMINTAQEAQRLVSACRYPLAGSRSFGPILARLQYQDYSPETANAAILPFAMIETREAVENLDAILGTPGLGGIYIGPADLSLSFGFPPGFDRTEPEMIRLIKEIRARAEQANIPCALHCMDPSYASDMARAGFSMVTDARYVENSAQAAIARFHQS